MKNAVLKLAAVIAVALAAAFVACSGDDDKPASVAVTGVSLSPATMSFAVGGAGQALTATVSPATATNKGVTWDSSPGGVVAIAGSGAAVTVSPVEAGTATITVTTADGGKTATCSVTVAAPVPVAGVSLSPATLSLMQGGPAGTLTATVQPANATDKRLTWSSEPGGVVTVAGTDGGAAVTPAAAGQATITVRSAADPSKEATCRVSVAAAVPATRLLLPAAVTIAAGSQGNNLTADVWPLAASASGVNWQSSNTAAVTVIGTGATAMLAGVGVGSSTITATSAGSPGATAACTVNVAGYVYREVYTPTDGDMIVNGEFVEYHGSPRAVAVDGSGAVHTAVYDYGVYSAAYYKDGVRVAVLPLSPGFEQFTAMSIHVTYDGRVYIAGYEHYYDYDIWEETTQARLCVIDGSTVTAVTLEGLGDWYYSDARAVHVAGGDVYVCGSLSEDAYKLNGVALWVNGKLHVYSDLVYGNPTCLATMGADLYMGGEMWGMVKIDPAAPGGYQKLGYEDADFFEMAVRSICTVGDVIYAAGFMGGDMIDSDRAYLWRDHVPQVLPWDPTCWDWLQWPCAHASAVTVGRDGAVYVFGSEIGIWSGYRLHRPVLWKDGARQVAIPIDSPEEGFSTSYQPLRSIAVRDVSGVAVAGVTLSPAALEMAVYSFETLTATISPGNATNQRLTWTNSNIGAVQLTASGSMATLEAVAPGRATITATSPDGPQASCVVDVITVPVVGVMTSPGSLDVGRGRLATIDAAVAPFNATDKSVTWASQNPNIVEVVGAADRTVSVRGVALGTAGVTVTTNDGGFTSTCTVTVVDATEPAIYMVGDFGMFIDGVPYLGIDRDHNRLTGVAVDDAGNVHAVGDYVPDSYDFQASYYKNGVRTPLPLAFASTINSSATGMALDANGDVYISGSESNPWWQHARLWKVAASDGSITRIPLQGADDGLDVFLPSEAYAVRVRDGHVWVAGYTSYLANPDDEWSSKSVATLWRDGADCTYVDPDDPDGYLVFRDLAITDDGYVYLLTGHYQRPMNRTLVSDPSAFERVFIDDPESLTMNRLHAAGNDYYAAGTRTDQAYVWVNGQRQVLGAADGATRSDATALFFFEGQVYLGGSLVIGDWDYYHTGLWIGSGSSYPWIGGAGTIPNDWPYTDYAAPRAIFVKR